MPLRRPSSSSSLVRIADVSRSIRPRGGPYVMLGCAVATEGTFVFKEVSPKKRQIGRDAISEVGKDSALSLSLPLSPPTWPFVKKYPYREGGSSV